MRVTKEQLERTVKRLREENARLRTLLVPRLYLAEPNNGTDMVVTDVEPTRFNFEEGGLSNYDNVVASDLCRSVVEDMVGEDFMPEIGSFTSLALVPIELVSFDRVTVYKQESKKGVSL